MNDSPVSRRRYLRLKQALAEAEKIAEVKTLDLYRANKELQERSSALANLLGQTTLELGVSKAQLVQAYSYAPNALLTLDSSGKVTSISKNAEEWFEVSENVLIGESLFELFDEQKQLFALRRVFGEHGLADEVETKVQRRTKDGQILILELIGRRVDNPLLPYSVVVSLRDVTAEEELKAEKVRAGKAAESLLAAGTSAYTVADENFELVLISDRAMQMFGYNEPAISLPYLKIFKNLSEEAQLVQLDRLRSLETGQILNFDDIYEIARPDGYSVFVRCAARWFDNPTAPGRLLWTNFEDVTELETQRRYTEALLNLSSSVLLTQDEDWKILSCSDAWIELTGYTRADTLGHDLIEFMTPECAQESINFRKRIRSESRHGQTHKNTIRLVHKQGHERVVELRSIIAIIEGNWRDILTIVDVTDITEANEKLIDLVNRDSLTKLLSRSWLQRECADGKRHEDTGLFIIDVDHFKFVNDSFGHDAGDALLKAYGATMKRMTFNDGHAIRLGGEEFAIIRPWKGWKDAHSFGETIRVDLAKTSVQHRDRQIHCTASVGFSKLCVDDILSEAMNLADLMQIEAKKAGRDKVFGADREMLAELKERGAFITVDQVQTALKNGEICYYFQPIWDTKVKAIEGFEALLRWVRPDGQVIGPMQFLDAFHAATRDAQYSAIDIERRKQAVAKLSKFSDAYVSFNYRLEQLAHEADAKHIHDQLEFIKDHSGRQLVIEISESAIDTRINKDSFRRELQILKDYGYLIALDDFGVDSSNFNRLMELPIDIVKLDKSMLPPIDLDHPEWPIIAGLRLMSHQLQIKFIAEGVEDKRQAIVLEEHEIYAQQGYLYSKPMQPEDVIRQFAPEWREPGAT